MIGAEYKSPLESPQRKVSENITMISPISLITIQNQDPTKKSSMNEDAFSRLRQGSDSNIAVRPNTQVFVQPAQKSLFDEDEVLSEEREGDSVPGNQLFTSGRVQSSTAPRPSDSSHIGLSSVHLASNGSSHQKDQQLKLMKRHMAGLQTMTLQGLAPLQSGPPHISHQMQQSLYQKQERLRLEADINRRLAEMRLDQEEPISRTDARGWSQGQGLRSRAQTNLEGQLTPGFQRSAAEANSRLDRQMHVDVLVDF